MFQWFRKHTKDGLERPDQTPIEVPLRDRPLSIQDQLLRFSTNEEIRQRLQERGIDTFEEADDFDVPDMDEEDRRTPYEAHFIGTQMHVEGLQARLDEQKAGMTEEMPISRQELANQRLRALKEKPKPQAAAAGSSEIKPEKSA